MYFRTKATTVPLVLFSFCLLLFLRKIKLNPAMPITQDIDSIGQIKMHQSFLSLRLKSYTTYIFKLRIIFNAF